MDDTRQQSEVGGEPPIDSLVERHEKIDIATPRIEVARRRAAEQLKFRDPVVTAQPFDSIAMMKDNCVRCWIIRAT